MVLRITRSSLVLLLSLLSATALATGRTGPVIEERPASGGASSSATSAATDASVLLFEQLQQYQSQLEQLTGRLEQLEHEVGRLREQQRVQYLDLDGRLNAAASQSAPAQAPAVEAPAAADGGERAQYDRALAAVREKRFEEAIKAFEQQLRDFPRGELAPQAMYWLGEMWLAAPAPDAPKAGRYFHRVYNEYPKHARAPVALYKHGLIQCQTGEQTRGRVTLNRVIIQHPGSPEAKLADTALRQQCP